MIKRRTVIAGGLGVLGASTVGYLGSLAACSGGAERAAMLRPLYLALNGAYPWQSVGKAWLAVETEDQIWQGMTRSEAIRAPLLALDDSDRKSRLDAAVQAEFGGGDIVQVDRWLVARSEARLAAARVLYG